MRAVVYEGPYQIGVEEIEKPKIQDNRDAILKVTSAAICGSDMHMYEGRTSAEPKTVLGHEIMGVIDQLGERVKEVKVGDRVLLPFNIACGMCENCLKGYTSACLVTHPEHAAAGSMIIGGVAKPSFIVSHYISIDEAPQAYEKFDRKEEVYTKVIIRFGDSVR